MELLKAGDFVVVYDSTYGDLVRGIVVYDECEGSQISVSVVRNGLGTQNYYDRKLVTKIN